MSKACKAAVALIAAGVVGCATPGVKFEHQAPYAAPPGIVAEVAARAKDGAMIFNLPISRIMVTAGSNSAKPADGGGSPSDGGGKAASGATITVTAGGHPYSVSVLPTESARYYRVTGINDFWSSNQLGIVKIANTDIPTSVSNTFTDLTKSRITAIGGLVTSGMSLAAMVKAEPHPSNEACTEDLPPFTIDVTAAVLAAETTAIDQCFGYQLNADIDKAPENKAPDHYKHAADAVRRDDFDSSFVTGEKVGVWPVPSCLGVTMKVFKKSATTPYMTVSFRVIDPDYVRLLEVPDKGTISMHSVCGADYSNTPVDKWGNGFDDISALEAQAAAIAKLAK